MKIWKKTGLFVCLAVLTAGCSSAKHDVDLDWQYSSEKKILSPLRFDADSVSRNDLAKAKALSKSDISFELVRVQDRRIPVAKSIQVQDGIIYEYVPDKLFSGVEGYVGSALKRFLTFGPEKPTVFKVEYEVRNLRTYIATGDFISGMFGKYKIEMEADVIVRDSTSKAVFRDTVRVESDEPRLPVKGQHPSADADARQMDEMMRAMLRKVAIHTAWRVRKLVKDQNGEPFINPDEDIWEESSGVYN